MTNTETTTRSTAHFESVARRNMMRVSRGLVTPMAAMHALAALRPVDTNPTDAQWRQMARGNGVPTR